MENIKAILTQVVIYFIEVFKYWGIFPEEFFAELEEIYNSLTK